MADIFEYSNIIECLSDLKTVKKGIQRKPRPGSPRRVWQGGRKNIPGSKKYFFAEKTCFSHGSDPDSEKNLRAPRNIF